MTAVDYPLGKYTDLSLSNRYAIGELVDAYSRCADRRDAASQMALFTEDTEYDVHEDTRNPIPTQKFRGRGALAPVFEDLKNYEVTTHFNGHGTIVLNGDQASGETYRLCHMIRADGSARNMVVLSLRYLDTFVKDDGVWLIRQRKAMLDWTQNRSFSTSG